MRICLVSREFPPFVGGGIGSYTRRFAAELAKRGHVVLVVTFSDDGLVHDEQLEGVHVRRIPFIRGQDWSGPDPAVDSPMVRAAFRDLCPAAALSMLVREHLAGVIESFRPEVIEFPDTGALGWFALNARRNGLMETAPIVVHVHSPSEWVNLHNRSAGTDRESRVLRLMEAECLRWADGLVCPSAGVAKWAEERVGLARGSIEPIPLVLGELGEERARAWEGGKRRVLFVGRLEPRKGVDLLVAAFEEAVARGADLHLDLVGADMVDERTGRLFGQTALERLVSPATRARICVHDRLAPEDVAGIRRGAIACVVPSPDDNFPYTCVEAMASGRPVLANRAGGMAEMIREGRDGWLVSPTVSSWAEALFEIGKADLATLVEMGRSARERIGSLCCNDTIVERRIAHFRRLTRTTHGVQGRRRVAVVNPRSSDAAALEMLVSCVARTGGCATGWRRLPADASVIGASPTACAEWLCVVDAYDGALAVDEEALQAVLDRDATARIAEAASPIEEVATYVCEDVPGLLLSLLGAGVAAHVVPEAIVAGPVHGGGLGLDPRLCAEDARRVGEALLLLNVQRRAPAVNPPPPPPASSADMRAERAEAELRRIRSSRAFAIAGRLSALARLAGLSRGG